ncbi:hypothetical protein MSPP1_001485 [Malassezia sp. CBS 17886]|nr:hypothetical protein MSPP1_001485 [Malassezia sp. CBS 17886]
MATAVNGRARTGSAGEAASTAVQVAVRIRPDAMGGVTRPLPLPLRTAVAPTSGNTLQLEPGMSAPAAGARDARQSFMYDRVFGPAATQDEMYRAMVEPLVQRFLDGYNTTVFAYGQTSSGKSYTMGTSEASEAIQADAPTFDGRLDANIGIVPRAAVQILRAIRDAQIRDTEDTMDASVQVSFLELYNEDLIDLLADDSVDARNQVQIRETRTGEIVWAGLRQHTARSASDVVMLLQQGMAMRHTHETEMNAQSSRSHAIFSITLTIRRWCAEERNAAPMDGTRTAPRTPRAGSGLPLPGAGKGPLASARAATPTRAATPSSPRPYGAATPRATPTGRLGRGSGAGAGAGGDGECITTTSKLHFVDLAGSERLKRTAAVGNRIREGISINSGLHALGNVISTLSDPVKSKRGIHIPYRDSKLTRLLQDSLGGNAHTLMIACVSSLKANVNETQNTLQYAQRARHIRNTVEKNETETGWSNVEYLQAQVLRLRKELELVRTSNELIVDAQADRAAPRTDRTALEQELLAWQDKYSALSRKNVQLTAELVAVDRQQAQRESVDSDFLASAEPVIVEYEKTVDSLESQTSMLKAALATAEEIVRDGEQETAAANQRVLQAEELVDTLRTSVRELQEHLEERTARIHDLEARLRRQERTPSAGSMGLGAPTLPMSSTLRRASTKSTELATSPQRTFGGILDYRSSTGSASESTSSRVYRVTRSSQSSQATADAAHDDAPPSAGPVESESTTPSGSTRAQGDVFLATPSRSMDLSGDTSFSSPSCGRPDATLEMVAAAERELQQLNELLQASAEPKQDRRLRGECLDRMNSLFVPSPRRDSSYRQRAADLETENRRLRKMLEERGGGESAGGRSEGGGGGDMGRGQMGGGMQVGVGGNG